MKNTLNDFLNFMRARDVNLKSPMLNSQIIFDYFNTDHGKKVEILNIPCVIVSVCKGRYMVSGDCVKYGGECTKGDCDYWQTEL